MEISDANKTMMSGFANALIGISNAKSCLVLNFTDHKVFTDLNAEKVDVFSRRENLYPDEGSWDIVFGGFPYGLKGPAFSIEPNGKHHFTSLATVKALGFLKKGGLGVFTVEPFLLSSGERCVRNLLIPLGYDVRAVFNTPQGFLKPYSDLRPLIIVVGQISEDPVFIAEMESERQVSDLVNSFNDKTDSRNLREGTLVDLNAFKGFQKWRIQQQIAAIESEYKNYTIKKISDIALEVNLPRTGDSHVHKENSVYIPKIGTQPAIWNLEDAAIKHQNYYQVVLDASLVDAQYLAAFFTSRLGRLVLESLLSSGFIPSINKKDLLEAEIAIPKLNQQREIIDSIRKLRLIQEKIRIFGDELAVNPISSTYTLKQVDSILTVVGELAESDKIKSLIREGESKRTEFKQTLSLDVAKRTKADYIELSAIKTIAGFLNTDGGTLLIGVDDDGRVTGLECEIDLFHKNKDKFLLHFKNLLKSKIGEQFYPFIEHNLVNVDGLLVLCVNCRQSTHAVFLDDKDFYVRTNPATDKLEGRKLLDYIQNHFKQ